MKSRSLIILLICVVIFIVSLFFLFLLYIPRIDLVNDSIILEVGTNYKETGYKTYVGFKDLTDKTIVSNNINKDKLGTYQVIYELKYKGKIYKKIRKIEVVDKIKPVIELTGNGQSFKCKNKDYQEQGYLAFDNYDGDITKNVKTIASDDKITYTVIDSSGNKTSITRKIKIKTNNKPTISLNGETIRVILGYEYIEQGYKATDDCDGDITNKVIVNSNVNTSKIGTYKVEYRVVNSNNSEVSVIREVIVLDKPTNGNGIIYLTFDDGPSQITSQILDILKEENIKATFFVVGANDSYNNIIKRAFDEGHTIALHSLTHRYNQIYASENAYFEDLYAIQNKVLAITGYKSFYTRFPGGSSNTVSNYNKGIMSHLVKDLEAKGFRYYDWNVESKDAGGAKTKEEIVNNVISKLSLNRPNMVLMHDTSTKTATLNSLREIIVYGKQNGYLFSNIDDSTPLIRHKVVN